MAINSDEPNVVKVDKDTTTTQTENWNLNALTEALGDLKLAVNDNLSVGRGSDNDVVLGSKQVSRNHALLSVLNGKLYVKDLDSSNGTFINDERIENNKSKLLKADDTVGFASFAFRVMTPMAATTNINADNVSDTNVEQPVVVEDEIANKDSEVPASAVIEGEVVDSELLDGKLLNSEAVDSEVVDDKNTPQEVASPVDKPAATVEAHAATPTPVEPFVVESTTSESAMAKEPTQHSLEDEPVVKETIIEEVLSSTDHTPVDTAPVIPPISSVTSATPSTAIKQEAMMSNDTSKETLPSEPVTNEPLMQEKAAHQEQVVSPEHDKTTKTELQEEADPDILRAKQAATAQFSGTANLGQPRDLGTEGNNAMDQAINNPTNAGHVEKKPSGGWFIWVFIAIIIIGLALWLFNIGGA